MKKTIKRSLLFCVLIVFSRCGNWAPKFHGAWECPKWGVLGLKVEGNAVIGTYMMRDKKIGYLSGSVKGRRMDYQWWTDVRPGVPYEGAPTASRGEGFFVIALTGNDLRGEWRFEGSRHWVDDWRPKRVTSVE